MNESYKERFTKCVCGTHLPQKVKLLTRGMERVLFECGQCGEWWQLTTDSHGGWQLSSQKIEKIGA